jgi:hypothetical protein
MAADLPADSIRLGARVTHVNRDAQSVEVRFTVTSGSEETMRASRVPRRVAAAAPRGPGELLARARRRYRGTLARHADLDGTARQGLRAL